jgi:hypothetical protein
MSKKWLFPEHSMIVKSADYMDMVQAIAAKDAQIAQLQVKLDKAVEALKKVQWIDNYYGKGEHCKCCSGTPDGGHSDYCIIRKAIESVNPHSLNRRSVEQRRIEQYK